MPLTCGPAVSAPGSEAQLTVHLGTAPLGGGFGAGTWGFAYAYATAYLLPGCTHDPAHSFTTLGPITEVTLTNPTGTGLWFSGSLPDPSTLSPYILDCTLVQISPTGVRKPFDAWPGTFDGVKPFVGYPGLGRPIGSYTLCDNINGCGPSTFDTYDYASNLAGTKVSSAAVVTGMSLACSDDVGTVTIVGTDFANGATITLQTTNGVVVDFSLVSLTSTQIVGTIDDRFTAGLCCVSVVNP